MDDKEPEDSRLAALSRWLREDLGFDSATIAPASADASFRRYFRVVRGEDTYIVMDAPPEKEDLRPYLTVGQMLASVGLNVPLVLARNLPAGLLLLTDLGRRQYLAELADESAVEPLYADALAALLVMQTRIGGAARALPPYDRHLLVREMELLPAWFLQRHLGQDVGTAERAVLDRLHDSLVQAALEQPATFVHRDYHSRNLMVTADQNPGVLDFQDAVFGPVTYDLVSLLKDCYVTWPPGRVRSWAAGYRRRLIAAGFALDADEGEFLRWFDLMGLQRHVKVLGIFCRLFYRDGKRQYLYDLPRVLDYVKGVASAYPETAEFAEFIATRVDPQFGAAQARALA